MKILSLLGLLWACSIPVAARLGQRSSNGNLVDVLSGLDDLSSLVSLLTEKNLTDTLATGGNFTVFAPTNDAFEDMRARLDGLTEDQITEVLLYHVTGGKVLSGDLSDGQVIPTLRSGSNVTVSIKQKGKWWWSKWTVTKINDSKIEEKDIEASNGAIHIIDEVLLPEDLKFNTIIDILGDYGKYNKLVDLLIEYNLTDALRTTPNLTLVAPTNYAFKEVENELKRLNGDPSKVVDILTYHVIDSAVETDQLTDGQSLTTLYPNDTITVSITEKSWYWKTWEVIKFNDAKVIQDDIEASNGFIQGVNKVLLPPSVEIPSTIVDIVGAEDKFSTLVGLLTNSSLIDALKAAGPFTLFAPTNKAFEEISDVLATKTPEEITNILLYHVVSAELPSDDFEDGQTFETLFQRNSLTVSIQKYGGWKCKWFGKCKTKTFINDAKLKDADIDASNGLIHVVNKVLLPS